MARGYSGLYRKSDQKAFVLSNFSGLNTNDDSTQIENNQAQDLLNVVITKEIKKRGGYTAINSTAITGSSGIYGLGTYYKTGGSDYLLYASHTTIGTINFSTGATASIITGLTTNERTRFKQFKNIVVITKQSDAPQKYNGTTGEALGGSPPTCPYQCVHKNYHFLAGNATYPSRLYYSNLDDNETWTALDFIDINPDDGDIITGLEVTLDSVIIFKRFHVYILYGDTPTYTDGLELWVIKQASTSTGATAQGGIAVIGKNIIYLSSNEGIQAFGGGVSTEQLAFDSLTSALLSKDITPTIKALNTSRLTQAEAVSFDNKYILSVPNGSSTTNNLNLVFDYSMGGWLKWDIPANCWTTFRNGGIDYLIFGSTTTGKIYRYTESTYSDNGTAISAYYKTKDYDLKYPANEKLYRKFYVTLNKSTDYSLKVTPQVDFGEVDVDASTIAAKASDSLWGAMVWGADVWGSATTSTSDKQIMNARGKYINFTFENSTLSETFRLRNLTQYFRIRGAR